jgi:hypothetical protein
MLFAMNSTEIKERPEPGLEVPTAKRSRPPLKAGAHGDVLPLHRRPHVLRQSVIRIGIEARAKLVGRPFPIRRPAELKNHVVWNPAPASPIANALRADVVTHAGGDYGRADFVNHFIDHNAAILNAVFSKSQTPCLARM